MRLRQRLALALILTAAPLVASFAWARAEWLRRADLEALRELVAARIASLGRERCEAAPETFHQPPFAHFHSPRPSGPPPSPPHGPPMQAFAYDAAFRAADPEAPGFPEPLRQAIENGAKQASRRPRLPDGGEGLELAVRTGWQGGRCSYVLARRFARRPSEAPLALIASVLPMLVVALGAVLVAAGPIVRRIRALTEDVRRSADTHYEAPVRAAGADEIAELGRAFNDTGAKLRGHLAALEQRDRTLRDFLADTTHDVMLPLTVLQGHLSELRHREAERGAPGDPNLVAAMQEAQYIASLIHNLGAAAKLESGEPLVEFHLVDMGALVERVVERHRPIAQPTGVALEFGIPEQPLFVAGDVTLLEQGVSNLVENAVRYNRRGGHVAVLLDESDTGGFRVRVIDDGPGVDAEQLRRLQERRQRGDEARQRHPGGLGLGLHIAQAVADRHGFELRLGRSEHGGLEATLSGQSSADA